MGSISKFKALWVKSQIARVLKLLKLIGLVRLVILIYVAIYLVGGIAFASDLPASGMGEIGASPSYGFSFWFSLLSLAFSIVVLMSVVGGRK